MKLMDRYSRPNFHIAGAMLWLRFHLNMLSSLIFAFSLILLIHVPKDAKVLHKNSFYARIHADIFLFNVHIF